MSGNVAEYTNFVDCNTVLYVFFFAWLEICEHQCGNASAYLKTLGPIAQVCFILGRLLNLSAYLITHHTLIGFTACKPFLMNDLQWQGDQQNAELPFLTSRCSFIFHLWNLLNNEIPLDAFENLVLIEKKQLGLKLGCFWSFWVLMLFLEKTASQDAGWSQSHRLHTCSSTLRLKSHCKSWLCAAGPSENSWRKTRTKFLFVRDQLSRGGHNENTWNCWVAGPG